MNENISTDDKIKKVIEELRPFMNIEGGDVEFIKYDNDSKTVFVKLSGACAMCTMQDDTLELGLLEAIKDEVPEVKDIVNVPL